VNVNGWHAGSRNVDGWDFNDWDIGDWDVDDFSQVIENPNDFDRFDAQKLCDPSYCKWFEKEYDGRHDATEMGNVLGFSEESSVESIERLREGADQCLCMRGQADELLDVIFKAVDAI
jgi:hypothetical protein